MRDGGWLFVALLVWLLVEVLASAPAGGHSTEDTPEQILAAATGSNGP